MTKDMEKAEVLNNIYAPLFTGNPVKFSTTLKSLKIKVGT